MKTIGIQFSLAIITSLLMLTSISAIPTVDGIDVEFILECSTWYESYELTSKSEFIMVWGKGAVDCYNMLNTWAGKLFLLHNEDLVTDEELETAITYLIKKGFITFSIYI